MDIIKPCPFCGEPPCTEQWDTMGAVECCSADCPVNPSVQCDNEDWGSGLDIAISEWNTRSNDALMREIYTTLDDLMAWDNNILDEPRVCAEYKACVQAALELVRRLELQGYVR